MLELCLFIRAVLSWFVMMNGAGSSPIYEFLVMLTEPILFPFRELLSRIPAMQQMPIDFSMLIAYFLLEFLRMLVIRF